MHKLLSLCPDSSSALWHRVPGEGASTSHPSCVRWRKRTWRERVIQLFFNDLKIWRFDRRRRILRKIQAIFEKHLKVTIQLWRETPQMNRRKALQVIQMTNVTIHMGKGLSVQVWQVVKGVEREHFWANVFLNVKKKVLYLVESNLIRWYWCQNFTACKMILVIKW